MKALPVTLLAIAFGGAVLFWGGARLQGIFVEERDAAKRAIEVRRRATEKYALVLLERQLREKLAEARPRIDAALADPLQSTPGLLAVDGPEQLLPRLGRYLDGGGTPVQELYAELANGGALTEDPWGERVALLGELRRAADRGDDARLTATVREFLDHCTRYVVPVSRDLPLQVRFVEELVRRVTPDRRLLEALLRDGLSGTRGRKLTGLQPLLLEHRARFTRQDFTFLAQKITELSRRTRVVHDDFDAQLSSAPDAPVDVPDRLDGPALIAGGAWYAAPLERNTVRGVAVDLTRMLEEIAVEMKAGGLLDGRDTLERGSVVPEPTTVEDLPLIVRSDSFAAESAAIDGRYALKTGLGVALGSLVAGVALLGALLVRRERRLLDSKASFVATVSHELRTPIASLRLMGETLERRLSGVESAKDFPSRIVQETDRLGFLIENILSFNRLEKANATDLEETTVEELVEASRADLAAYTKKPVTLTILEGGDVSLRVDVPLVRLLISNLIHNSCKYNTRERVEMIIRALTDSEARRVLFTDNGTGIDRREWDAVFTEFVRARKAPKANGFGLGLALCRRIMRLHDGSIRIVDSSETGTTFEMVFPSGESKRRRRWLSSRAS